MRSTIRPGSSPAARSPAPPPAVAADAPPDFADVHGQLLARRALEIAAAGGHNALLVGPPGAGKTMMARRLRRHPAAADVRRGARGHGDPLGGRAAAAGHRAGRRAGRSARRTTRSPTSRWSAAARCRGRARSAWRITACCSSTRCRSSAGTCSKCCASRSKKGVVRIARAARTATFPAAFMLIGAMNPCPCGYAGDVRRGVCRCTPQQVARYSSRLSGPLRDRIDLTVAGRRRCRRASCRTRPMAKAPPRSADAVVAARERQMARDGVLNARLDGRAAAAARARRPARRARSSTRR